MAGMGVNCDQVVNDHGKEIASICCSSSCYIVSNLAIGEKQFGGDFTFVKDSRKSQNDIILADVPALSAIKKFTIHKIGWNPSDHAPISTECKMVFSIKSLGVSASWNS